ncbi:MAG: glycosyltransferase family 4 protein [Rhodospirillales bacterium]|nr:glycosyltransferase family 4 protein [Rhodospirillales bacterium]
MRILYSHRIQSRDGQSVHVEELVAALRALGHEVVVVGPGFYEHSGFGGESALVARLRRLLPGAVGELAELAYNFPAYRRLARACEALRPDLIYERYNLYYLAGAWLARRRGIRFFLEVNGPLAEERTKHGGLQLRALARRCEASVWRAADLALPVTAVLRERLLRVGVRPERARVVPNGVVLERFVPRQEALAGEAEAPVLGFVGFVRDWHGLDTVIRGMAAQPGMRVTFTVVGEGPAKPALQALAAELGVAERVRFVGLVAHETVPATVSAFDIALQPRSVDYASPLKIFDYMAAGRAIVAPDQPNIREVLEDGRTALLFDPARPEAMWEAVARLLADPQLRRRLGQAARAELEARDYTWRGNAARIVTWAGEAVS